jgi:hypothetical protein
MATVPQYEIGQVKDKAVSGGFQQIQTNSDAFGAGIANAQIQQGKAISQLGDLAWQAAVKQRDQFDQAVLKDRDNELQDFIRDQLDVDGAFLSLKGKNALNQKASVEKIIQERFKLLSKDIEPRILQKWKEVANTRINSALGRIDSHSRTQTDFYYNNVSDSRIKGAVFDVISNHTNAPIRDKYIQFGLNEIDQKLERSLGILPGTQDEDEIATRRDAHLQFTSAAHSGVVEKYLEERNHADANEYFLLNEGEIKKDVRLQLKKAIASNTRDAEIFDHVQDIWNTPGLSDTEQIDKAKKITDKSLINDVISGLEHEQIYRDKEDVDAYAIADDEADELVLAGGITSLDQLPPELLNRMSTPKKTALKREFREEEIRLRDENHRVAKENVYSLYTSNRLDRSNPGPTVDDILKMSGPEQLAFFDKREDDAAREDTDIETDAYKAAKKLQVTGTLYKDMPSEITNLLTGDAIQLLQDREEINIERIETAAYNEGISLVEQGKEVPDELLFQMDGIQRLAIKKETETFESTAEAAAYDKLLGYLLIPGNDLDGAVEAGYTKGVSNLHLTNIYNAENTTKAAQAKIDKTISEMKNYVNLLDMAQSDYSGFAANWEAHKEKYALSISETNWKQLDDMSRNPTTAKSIFTRREMVFTALDGLTTGQSSWWGGGSQAGISGDAKDLIIKEGEQGDNVRGFVDEIDRRVQAWSDENDGKPVSDQQFKIILSDVVSDKVFYDDAGGNSQLPASFISDDERSKAYVKIGGEQVYLNENTVRDDLIIKMKEQNIPITEQKIMQLYTEWKAGELDLSITGE